ncbi:hypothetical protein PT285_11120 [Lactobacillus sp. ESL0791]|uniref:hypothetical protein n=1 Tax=Lactobacillus sp. ESL0791 TaxID=2983234 RepID=UPI0023F93BA7|nr:hypothetical protein [Lactobacillus sp. ESL0791]MDF7639952.1 hypothetical protein [Lactobacillus sp. ESL0791]
MITTKIILGFRAIMEKRRILMDILDTYIKNRSKIDPKFKEELKKADEKLDSKLASLNKKSS